MVGCLLVSGEKHRLTKREVAQWAASFLGIKCWEWCGCGVNPWVQLEVSEKPNHGLVF